MSQLFTTRRTLQPEEPANSLTTEKRQFIVDMLEAKGFIRVAEEDGGSGRIATHYYPTGTEYAAKGPNPWPRQTVLGVLIGLQRAWQIVRQAGARYGLQEAIRQIDDAHDRLGYEASQGDPDENEIAKILDGHGATTGSLSSRILAASQLEGPVNNGAV